MSGPYHLSMQPQDCKQRCHSSTSPPCNCPYDHAPRCRYNHAAADYIASGALQESYDYIIVGGGASGSALAATLAERFSVLLLESGKPQVDNLYSVIPWNWPLG
jgi:hypothetical protein